jgi:hypothetical protein
MKGVKDIMKILRQTLFIAIITICASFAVFAQKERDEKRTPPKNEGGKPPVVIVKDKDPKPDRPRKEDRNNDNKNKRPESTNLNLLRFWQE